MNQLYLFHDKLILRTPRFPLQRTIDEQTILQLLQEEAFLEALYLASPVLYKQCIKWKDGLVMHEKDVKKIKHSLAKYYTRMTSRCTPFGLFSGCAVVPWGESNKQIIIMNDRIKRHTRLDMHYLCSLAQKLAVMPGIQERLLFFSNNSLYKIGDEIRYIEYTYIAGKRSHQISSIAVTATLEKLLKISASGCSIDTMVQLLKDDDISEEEAGKFVDELIKAQLIVSELDPAITGEEFIHQIVATLKERIPGSYTDIHDILHVLEEVSKLLLELDEKGINNPTKYKNIMALLNRLDHPYEENKLFQTDIITVASGNIDVTIKDKLGEALSILNRLTIPEQDNQLQSFVNRFIERYEEMEMSLLEVLDTETGIGFSDEPNRDLLPLVQDVYLQRNGTEKQITWGKLENFLVTKLTDDQKESNQGATIAKEELNDFQEDWQDLPSSLSVMFRMIDKATGTIFVESVSGPSAACLLGRFAHSSNSICEVVNNITQVEQDNDPDIVYAEIIHLPESRTGNILLHPPFRKYEIPYLASSSLTIEHQITTQDLLISIRNNRIVLRSKRLDKEIMPRLSNAHNYANNALPVYKFLCSLQHQGKRKGLYFNWGGLSIQHIYFPRVSYKNIILSLATWHFTRKEINALIGHNEEKLQVAVRKFCIQWKLPRYIVLVEGDNTLLVDFESEIMVQAWIAAIKEKEKVVLKEFLFSNGNITDQAGNQYSNQLIAIYIKQAPSYKPVESFVSGKSKLQPVVRKFSLGSEWLYYKLYCGTRTADKILLEAIQPITQKLSKIGLIDKWFFVRYNDPNFHLRVRFQLTDHRSIGEALEQIYYYISPFEKAGYIWKSQTDTYNRELERYGSNSIELAESFFHHDSNAVLNLLNLTSGDQREELRWLWGLRSINELLNNFCFSTNQKLVLLSSLKDAYAKEFNSGKSLKEQLKVKLRESRKKINEIMDENIDTSNELYTIVHLLKERSGQLSETITGIERLWKNEQLQMPFLSLIGSYIHMLVNRLIVSNPRLHELVMYDFLFHYYQSNLARQKQEQNELLL